MSPARPPFTPMHRFAPPGPRQGSAWALALALALVSGTPAVRADVPALKPMKGASKDSAGAETAAPPAAAASAPMDPLEQLRQRLAGKLANVKTGASTEPGSLRLVTQTSGGPGPTETVQRSVVRKAATAKPAPAVPAGGHGAPTHWSYQGPAGPQTWGGLRPEFKLCGAGQRQSPIDIRGGLAVDLEPVKFAYQASRFGVIDNGHTVQANLASGNHIELGGKRFELVQLHFHRPSEERIDGRQFEMSVHLVHKDDQGRLAVVAVLLDKGEAQPAVQQVWNNLPLERHDEAAARVTLDPSEILPADRRYYTYMGSMTTPPCSEGVQWVVMRQPVSMSAEQLELFARIYPMNARPLQQATGRRILQSQ
ncbi:MAG: carbonic anhydrase family protein [Rubrivivax sp.]|nr:carbonic anhydrase family protein [Rubrivivax sp.]